MYKSNFYSNLLVEKKIEKISTKVFDEHYEEKSSEIFVDRSNFKNYIVDRIVITPIIYK